MLGVLDEDGTAFTFTENAGDEVNSRIYSVHVKKKCASYDKTDDYGETVLRSWNDDEGTICFQTEWEGKVGEAVPSDEKVKKLVERMSSMAAFTKVQIMDGQILEGQSLRFVEKFLDTEQFKLEFPIDQAIIGSNV
ncbi:hypothetical protein PRIPAC_87832 [Pristionchus pacificus]|uniref:Uncharacterized protein n=1 Tax=Pristionchus pacificus TaxID=54126 RepID=A0A2A6B8D1_PRIPA|nr:hypothetical protein PRIPAC_87832 [Pristionchus pacificus]|eukprot:PDM62125.1 hypothetical protein PRIPAC_51567 [Pristionchus pacificus]